MAATHNYDRLVSDDEKRPARVDDVHEIAAAMPHVTVEYGSERFPAVAREITGAERDRLWAKLVSDKPRFAEYNEKTGSERDAEECVRLSVEHGADINAANDAGQTALHLAAAQRDESFIRFLIAQGARLDAKDTQGRTPLDVALGVGGGGGRGRRAAVARENIAAVLRELARGR